MMTSNSSIQDKTALNFETAEFRIIRITLYVLILFLSCVGNSLVAVVIIKARGTRTSSNVLILSLAVCDFLTPVLSIPFDIAYEERNYVWPFGEAMCIALWPLQTAFSTSSSLTLAAISLDRFRALVKPLSWYISLGKLIVCVLAIYVVSICLCIPYFVVLKFNVSEKSCHERWPNEDYKHAYTILLFLCQYALPLLTMSVFYKLIYLNLRSNRVRLFSMDPESRGRSFSRESTKSRDSMCFRLKEQNIRLAKMFVIVVVVFAISMFPNQVLWFWIDFGNGRDHHLFHYISVACRLCTYANSVLNPLIYALKSKDFRSGFAMVGRATVMQPLRKISSETRRIVRKLSGNVLDSQSPLHGEMKSSPAIVMPNENFGASQLNSAIEELGMSGNTNCKSEKRKNPAASAVIQPPRKVSSETREFVGESSGTVSPDSQIFISIQKKSSAGEIISSEGRNVDAGKTVVPRRAFSCNYKMGYGTKGHKDLSVMGRRLEGISEEMTDTGD